MTNIMKKHLLFLSFLGLLLGHHDGFGQATDLFFSEYVEGSSNNKYLEIYNATGAAVNLGTYDIQTYFNGSTGAGATLALSGTLADGAVYVIANNSATVYTGTPDLSTASSVMNFNGNDAVVLRKSGVNLDVIGVIGSGANFAQNATIRRKGSVCSPTTTFNLAGEWDSFGINIVADLGMHTSSCMVVSCTGPPTIPTSNLSIPGRTDSSLVLLWTNGDGASRIVIAREATAVTAIPANNTTYTANATFGSGTNLGSNQFVVFNGSASSAVVTGLSPGTVYHFAIYEYNCPPGNETYLLTAETGNETVLPANIELSVGCVTNTSIDLNWTLPTGAYDGIVIFARQGATPADPNMDETSYIGASGNFGLAPTYGNNGSLVYKGGVTSVTITGLTMGLSYTFKAFTYKNSVNSSWSSGTQRTKTIELNTVLSPFVVPSTGQVQVGWTNPPVGCFDEVMVVANLAAGVTFMPTGNGSAYTANPAYAAPDQVVFKGTGNSVTVTGLTNGTTYCFEIFVRQGTTWSAGMEVCGTPGIELFPGDLILIGFDNNVGSGVDKIVLTNLVDLPTGTSFSVANAVYEVGDAANVRSEKWFSAGGTADSSIYSQRITYLNATTIPKGSILCIELPTGFGILISSFSVNGTALTSGPDFSVIEDAVPNGVVNFSTSNPDAIFVMQGGWTINSDHGLFTGRVLGGIQDGGAWYNVSDNLSNLSNGAPKRRSRIPPDIECFAIQGNLITGNYSSSYSGTRTADQYTLISNIVDFSNTWTVSSGTSGDDLGAAACAASGIFTVSGSVTPGLWRGVASNDWFFCGNWDNRQVPDETIDVTVGAAPNDAVVDHTSIYSDRFSDTARCNDLRVSGPRKVGVSGNTLNVLEVNGDLTITGTGGLDMDDGNDNQADGQVVLYGNWDNQVSDAAFEEGNGTIRMLGSTTQSINNPNTGIESFFNLEINKPGGEVLLVEEIAIDPSYSAVSGLNGQLNLTQGKINCDGNQVDVQNENPNAIINHSAASYVYEGVLRRAIRDNTAGYDFPVGSPVYYELASIDIVGIATTTDIDVSFDDNLGSTALVPILTEASGTYTEILNAGFWTIEDNPARSFTGRYDLTLRETGFTNGGASQYTTIKRTGIGSWFLDATYLNFTDLGTVVIATRVGHRTFSDFAIALDMPAPIDLARLQATPQGDEVLLTWQTSQEQNTDRFIIERSTNGQTFDPIGSLAAAGNSNQSIDYQLIDSSPIDGQNHYRLQMIDLDGTVNYSSVVTVTFAPASELTVLGAYPNPTEGRFTLQVNVPSSGPLALDIIGVDGKVWREENITVEAGLSEVAVDLMALPAGVYFYRLEAGGERIVGKVVRR